MPPALLTESDDESEDERPLADFQEVCRGPANARSRGREDVARITIPYPRPGKVAEYCGAPKKVATANASEC